MNDYFNSLFTRSFSLDINTQTVRPRLPSMFENQPIDHLTKVTFSNETQQDQDNDDLSFMAKRHSFTPHSIKTRGDNNHEGGGYQEQTAPHIITEHNGVNAQSKKPYPTNPLFGIPQSATRELNQEQLVGYKPNFNIGETNHSNFNLQDWNQPKPPISSQAYKPATGFRIDKSESNQETQRLPDNKQGLAQSPTKLVVDPSLLDRLVTEKMALSANKKHAVHSEKEVTKTLQHPPVLFPQDISKLNIQWPQTVGKAQSFNIKNETVLEQAEPIINVTIGRIEVLATQAPTNNAPKNQTPKSTTMSLDEYLNKRNGNPR